MVGNFSNGGVDTFDPAKQYVGIRLQQGVPLLDRDWNELEDIRRHYEQTLREHYIGDGVPDGPGFRVSAADADDDVVIGPGRIMVAGLDVANPHDVLFSEQGGRVPLPAARPGRPTDVIELWLAATISRIDASVDPDLGNEQDVNIETCVRDRLEWSVVAVMQGDAHPPGAVLLALVTRRPDVRRLQPADITDARRTELNLARTVDRLGELGRRIDALEVSVGQLRGDLEELERDVNELFWELTVSADRTSVLWGATATITVVVRNRNDVPVRGARLALSTSWGTLPSSSVTTGANGAATFQLIGIKPDIPFKPGDIGVLQTVAHKVELAQLKNPGAIQYARVAVEPTELAIISRYTPNAYLSDLAVEIPTVPIVAAPPRETATVTIHAVEGAGAIVRGVGSIQVEFGGWVRDWVRDKLRDVVERVQVEARIGDVLRRNLDLQNQELNLDVVARRELPVVFQAATDTTNVALKATLFDNGELDDDELHGSGVIAQVVAQEATAAIGAAADRAIAGQVALFEEDTSMPGFDALKASQARSQLTQASSQLTAGLTQSHKQLFSLPRKGV